MKDPRPRDEPLDFGKEVTMDIATYMVFAALIVIPAWKIFGKAGLTPALSLLVFIPYVGEVIALAILAFAEWSNDDSGPPPTSIENYGDL